MTVNVASAALTGIEAALISVETRICSGPGYHIIGMAGDAVRESLYRVGSAIDAIELHMPHPQGRRLF